ncbi:MAG TPA: NAD(P)H-dependent glycerol-3-phosphate dehydrogenase [bacterium]|nr:NAD(P)H-dependent glycerol-3-phosphate dehydrogenase [bacterium]HND78407.1 NAD(P)H-dependent glycerol-3-phosphate dehydrogenase [bacterium]HNI11302.1 NAD(P)H-dependent glycerol-3-phosphate dehydrogenase [bacterium]
MNTKEFMDTKEIIEVGVIGGGSFGTAMAIHLARNGYPVTIWAHDAQAAEYMQTQRENKTYLPGVVLPNSLTATSDLQQTVRGKKLVLQVNPSHATRDIMQRAVPFLEDDAIILNCTKGIENESLLTMSELLLQIIPSSKHSQLAFLSGPSFAREVALGAPTAVTISSKNPSSAQYCQKIFASERFRVYTTDDIVGSELASALKNVIAIAAGISDGLGYGHNTRAALITRGVAEILRLGKKMGAKEMTFLGLSGMGDLVLTCTGDLSRNRSVGIQLGQGKKLEEILASMKMVAEGVKTAKAAYALAQKHGIEMPIIEQVYRVIFENKDPRAAVYDLMTRESKSEA